MFAYYYYTIPKSRMEKQSQLTVVQLNISIIINKHNQSFNTTRAFAIKSLNIQLNKQNLIKPNT